MTVRFNIPSTMKVIYLLIGLFLIPMAALSAQADCDGCSDHPLLPRMPDYILNSDRESDFGAVKFYFDKEYHQIEGKKFQLEYRHESYEDKSFSFPSRLQILRNYSKAIQSAGGRVLFERVNATHGYYTFSTAENKEVWVKISPSYYGNRYELEIIEREGMRQDLVMDANVIKTSIDIYGKIAIQGIFFDVAKATIRPESEPALLEIAKYLTENPSVSCWVVGHTDADGSFEVNSKLSLERATAIKVALETKHGIAANRLFAEGVGPLAPVASNNTEEGKQKNRRVELVLK